MRDLAILVGMIGLSASAAVMAQDDSSSPPAAATPESSEPAPAAPDASSEPASGTTANSDWGLAGERDIDYIAVLGSYLFADSNRGGGADSGAGGSLIFGRHFANHFGWEANYSMDIIEMGPNGGSDFYRHTLGGDLTYSFGDRQHFTPFLLVGGGGDFTDAHPRNLNGPSGYVDGGAGIVTPTFWHNRVRLRAEGRVVHDFLSEGGQNGHTDIRASVGFEIPFYAEKPYNVPPPPAPVQVVKIEKTGLEDSDGDGVVDTSDKCPDTPPHTRVDGDGCPIPKVLRLDGVTFEFNKWHLRPDSETILSYVTRIMQKYPEMQVELAGYTDSKGGVEYNIKLSQKRANAVKEYLVAHGIEAGRMQAKGYGKENPVESNDTDEGREHNRRVELHTLN